MWSMAATCHFGAQTKKSRRGLAVLSVTMIPTASPT